MLNREGLAPPSSAQPRDTGQRVAFLDDNVFLRAWWWFRDRLPQTSFMRSGLVTSILLFGLTLAFSLLWRAHQRARFHQLTTKVLPPTAPVTRPGGQEAITLSRLALLSNTAPEFVSATLLPGVGMQILQIAAAVPNRGSRNLLLAPTLSHAEATPATIASAPFHLHVSARREPNTRLMAEPDVIGLAPAHEASSRTTADGGEASGSFSSGSANGNLGVDADVSAVLTGRALDLEVRLRNTTGENRYAALDWAPRFLAPNGSLRHLALTLPSTTRVPGETRRGAQAGPDSFAAPAGRTLDDVDFDATYGALKREFLADGPVLRLTYLDDGTVLRMSALGPLIRSVHLHTDAATHTLLLGFSSNDPFASQGDDPDILLRPGQTALWHLRLDILPITNGSDDLFGPVR